MQPKDITQKYIKENFHLDDERQNITISYKHEFDFEEKYNSIGEFINELQVFANNVQQQYNYKSSPSIQIREFYDWSVFELIWNETRLETDKEVIKRLQGQEKKRISNKMIKGKNKAQRYKQYQKLKKEFEE